AKGRFLLGSLEGEIGGTVHIAAEQVGRDHLADFDLVGGYVRGKTASGSFALTGVGYSSKSKVLELGSGRVDVGALIGELPGELGRIDAEAPEVTGLTFDVGSGKLGVSRITFGVPSAQLFEVLSLHGLRVTIGRIDGKLPEKGGALLPGWHASATLD